jgi:hypothetical protein
VDVRGGGFDQFFAERRRRDRLRRRRGRELTCGRRPVGDLDWAYELVGSVAASPTFEDGIGYVGDHNGYLVSVSAGAEDYDWLFETGGRVHSSATVADGTVYAGSDDGNLYALDAEDGTEQWRFETDAGFDSSPTVVDGVVYVGGMDGTVYALDADGEGSSRDSRVELGTLGHHHSWADEDPGAPEGLIDEPIRKGPYDFSNTGLARDGADPFELVEVTGLPDSTDVTDVYAEYELEGSGEPIRPEAESGVAYLVEPDQRDGTYLLAPLAEADGAQVRLKITDGRSYSGALSLDVQALPSPGTAAGAFDELQDALDTLVRKSTEAVGLSYPDDLRAGLDDPESVDPALTELFRAYDMVSNPDNPRSFTNLEFEGEELGLTERLVTHMRFAGQADAVGGFVESDDAPIHDVGAALRSAEAVESPNTVPSSNSPQASGASYPREFQPGDPLVLNGPAVYAIDGPQTLSTKMKEYRTARRRLRDVRQAEEILDHTVSAMGLVAIVASFGSATPAVTSIKTGLEVGLTASSVLLGVETVATAFLPCCAVETRFEQIPSGDHIDVHNEDEKEPQLVVVDVRVDVKSDKNMPQGLFGRVLDELEGQVTDGVMDRVDRKLSEMESSVVEYGISSVFDQANLNREIYFEWPNVDLMGDDPDRWLESEIRSAGYDPIVWNQPQPEEGRLTAVLDPVGFSGNETATNILNVDRDADHFPHGFWADDNDGGRGKSKTVTGNRITVNFPRDIHTVEAGEQYELDFYIREGLCSGFLGATCYFDPPTPT